MRGRLNNVWEMLTILRMPSCFIGGSSGRYIQYIRIEWKRYDEIMYRGDVGPIRFVELEVQGPRAGKSRDNNIEFTMCQTIIICQSLPTWGEA
jgi:hypothetical protein